MEYPRLYLEISYHVIQSLGDYSRMDTARNWEQILSISQKLDEELGVVPQNLTIIILFSPTSALASCAALAITEVCANCYKNTK